jgi:hypothetical protein
MGCRFPAGAAVEASRWMPRRARLSAWLMSIGAYAAMPSALPAPALCPSVAMASVAIARGERAIGAS